MSIRRLILISFRPALHFLVPKHITMAIYYFNLRERERERERESHAAVGSLGVTPSIDIFAKETCFQGAFLLNNGCTMRGMMSPRLVGPGAGSAQVLSSVMCSAVFRTQARRREHIS